MDTLAKDIMSREVLSADPEMCVEDAIKLLVNNRITGLPVVDAQGVALGVLSEFDIIEQISGETKVSDESFQKPIRFSKNLLAVEENTDLGTILKLFVDKKVRRLPVLNTEKKVVGMITRRDIMRVLYYRAKFT